jgi:hypothetical protein
VCENSLLISQISKPIIKELTSRTKINKNQNNARFCEKIGLFIKIKNKGDNLSDIPFKID